MATELTVQEISLDGLTPTFSAADANGNYFSGSGKEFVYVKNGGSSAITVTIASQQPCNQGEIHNVEVSVAASGEAMIGPLPEARFEDSSGHINISYSDVTSVTVAVIRLPEK